MVALISRIGEQLFRLSFYHGSEEAEQDASQTLPLGISESEAPYPVLERALISRPRRPPRI